MGFAKALAELTQAFPDLQTWIEDLVIDEQHSRVAVRWVAEGIHRDTFLGLEPTYQRTTFTGIEILEVAGGQITGRWGEWDFPFLQQASQVFRAD
jgi:predicted ester cyclase